MADIKVRRLPVVSRDKRLVGPVEFSVFRAFGPHCHVQTCRRLFCPPSLDRPLEQFPLDVGQRAYPAWRK